MSEQPSANPPIANLHPVGSPESVLPVSQRSYEQVDGTLKALAHIDSASGSHNAALEVIGTGFENALRQVSEGDDSFKSSLLVHAAHLMANPAAVDQYPKVLKGLERSGISEEDVRDLDQIAHTIQGMHRSGAIRSQPGNLVFDMNTNISRQFRDGKPVSADRVLALQSMASSALVGWPMHSDQYRTAMMDTFSERLHSNASTSESGGDRSPVAPNRIGATVLGVLPESDATVESEVPSPAERLVAFTDELGALVGVENTESDASESSFSGKLDKQLDLIESDESLSDEHKNRMKLAVLSAAAAMSGTPAGFKDVYEKIVGVLEGQKMQLRGQVRVARILSMVENAIIALEGGHDGLVSFATTSASFLDQIESPNRMANLIGEFESAGVREGDARAVLGGVAMGFVQFIRSEKIGGTNSFANFDLKRTQAYLAKSFEETRA